MEHGGSASPDRHLGGEEMNTVEEVIVLETDFSEDAPSPAEDAQTAGSDNEPDALDAAAAAAAEEDQPEMSATPAPDIVVKFTCPFCPTELGEKEEWIDHVAKAHSARAPTVCYICARAFSTALGMNLHFSKEHPGDSLRTEFVADSIGNEDKGPVDGVMASFYSNLDAAIPKKGTSRTIVVRRPAHKSGSAPEDEMERHSRKRKQSHHRPGRETVEEDARAPVKIRGRRVVGAEYDEIQRMISEHSIFGGKTETHAERQSEQLEPIASHNGVGGDYTKRRNRKRWNKPASASPSCPSCGTRCENEGALQIHIFEKHDLLWCQRCGLKANETEMTQHLARKHGIDKRASYSFLVEWNSRGADDDDEDSGNDLPVNVHTPNEEACDDISDGDEISIVFDNLIENDK